MKIAKPLKVIIVGRDAAAWLSANALHSAFAGSGVTVEVVELTPQLRPVDVFTSLPALEPFHTLIGLEETDVLKATSGTYSLGQNFINFSGVLPSFFHPYGSYGCPIGRTPFFQYWLKARQNGLSANLDDFSLNAVAAKNGKFFLPDAEIARFSRSNYGYHLHAASYVSLLRTQALKRRILQHSARNIAVKCDQITGDISSILLDSGKEVFGDLFLDCTGSNSELLGRALGEPFESWTDLFYLNRTVTTSVSRFSSVPAYAEVRAQNAGIMTIMPLQDVASVQFCYHDALLKDEEALRAVSAVLGRDLLGDAVVDARRPGTYKSAWQRNCIAIGEAACVLDKIDCVNLQMVQQGLVQLINLFPLNEEMALERDEYNEVMREVCLRIRDFQMVHYKFNEITQAPLWEAFRNVTLTESLKAKTQAFSARGLVLSFDHETFEDDSWLSIFSGHGLIPATYDPALDLVSEDDAIRQFVEILRFIRDQVSDMSSHDAYLELFAAKESSVSMGLN